ncbi:MAG: methyltransferase domain-containing protein [Lysobacterales bacterium]
MTDTSVRADVRRYYGEVLQSSRDLKTGACCPAEAMPAWLRPLLADLHPEINERFYGCGSPLPPALEGHTVLDLGCGTGRDAYLLSRLVGEGGRVIGVDMTPEQLEVARRHQDWQAERYGHARSNVRFVEGYIEDLAACGIADASVDVVVSNCVLNLAPDKARVFAEIFRVLKPGGELYFSDVFADRRIPTALRSDTVLLGECLGGALYVEDFRRVMAAVGCADARVVSRAPIPLLDPAIEAKLGMVRFESITVRAFKLDLEDRCEDYGQLAIYRGGLPQVPHAFDLDDHHRFETGRPLRVCGNTFDMLASTRYAGYFELMGDKRTHFGLFDCAPASPTTPGSAAGGCC